MGKTIQEEPINAQIAAIGVLIEEERAKKNPDQTKIDDYNAQSLALKQQREPIRHPPKPPVQPTQEELQRKARIEELQKTIKTKYPELAELRELTGDL